MTRQDIEDLYELSPLQQGMLFHALAAPDSGVYLIRMVCTLQGRLDEAQFEAAWQHVTERTPILRTSFHWETIVKPVQVVHRRLPLPFERHDWRDVPAARREAQLTAHLDVDAARGSRLDEAPLSRVALMRLADDLWQFVWSFPHILLEGWSASIVVADVFAAYRALRGGAVMPTVSRPRYRDYVAWQQKQDAGKAEAYWRHTLAGFSAPTPLVIDRPALTEAPRYERIRTKLDPAASAALQTLARDQRLTLNTVFQGAWAVLLSRYSGERDVVFGSVVSGREVPFPGIESLVGLCVNTLPARVAVPAAGAVAPWLLRLQRAQAEMREFEYTSLLDIQRWSDVPRGTPLFQTIFVFENWLAAGAAAPADGELRVVGVESHEGGSGYPLVVEVAPGREMSVALAYDATRIDGSAIRLMLGHYESLLRQIANDPHGSIGAIDVLDAGERQQILSGWNDTAAAYDRDACIHDFVLAQAARTPAAAAVTFEGHSYTYQALTQRSEALAGHLQALGVGPGVLAGVCMERSADMVVALLAVLRAGGAYVPLDPSFPQERLGYMVADAGCRVLLVDAATAAGQTAPGLRLVRADEPASWSGALVRARRPAATDLAYVIYTSGSTGRPKGVAIPHRAAVNFLQSMVRDTQMTADDRLVAVTTISFDIAGLEIYLPLITGAEVVVASRDTAADAQALAALLDAAAATFLQATPATWRMLIESGWAGRDRLHMLCGGEALSRDLADALAGRGAALLNLYGPTETTIWSSVEPITPGVAPVSIGRPIANTQLFILDDALQPVPARVQGHLYIGGDGLARGYWNRPDLTAEKFVPNPFGAAGERMYATGDLARYREDGRVECLGRADHQVKVRGFRIELGEIEAVLRQHPAVADAVALVREDAPGDRRIVGYVVPADAGPPAADLRSHLRESLPEYMVPSALVTMDAWPLTPNGKIDRKALPAPDGSRSDARVPFVAPRTPIEEVLAGIWCDVLGLATVGIHDNFFELGGHSLRATQVASRVRAATGLELPLRRIFQMPTIAALAGSLHAAGTGAPALPPLVAADRSAGTPLSFAQERLWFVHQLNPEGAAYHIAGAVRLRGPLDLAALDKSFAEIIRRHEAVRSGVRVTDGSPEIVVAPAGGASLTVIDVSDRAEPESEIEQLLAAHARRPFDLAAPPLMRTMVVRAGAEDHVLGVVLHHLVADAWSINVLVRELSVLYNSYAEVSASAYADGAPSPLPELAIQYGDFAAWQRGWLQGDSLGAQLGYWRERLQGAPLVLDLPTDRLRPPVQAGRGSRHSAVVPLELSDAVRALGRREGVTPYMTLLSAFQVLLQRYSGQDDFIIGSPIAGRTRLELEPIIGFFANSLVMRTDLSGDPPVNTLLARVRESALAAYLHQDVPFEKLVEELRPPRDLSRNPVVQVMFALQNAPTPPLALKGITWLPQQLATEWSPFDLTLFVHESEHGFVTTFQYNTDLFEPATMAALQRHFQRLLAAMVAQPLQRVSELPMMAAAERQQVVVEWNATTVAHPAGVCIHQLFEAQVDRTPAALAVAGAGAFLSYAELDRDANRIAHYLRDAGVGPERRVGICLERAPQLLAAILGVLKAGGAYIPIDPGYPADRIQFMLDDAGAEIVLTQRSLLPLVQRARARAVCLDRDRSLFETGPDSRPPCATTPAHLAYAIYTSGSTGRPKGVQIDHAGLVNLAAWHNRVHAVTPADRATQLAGLGFDATVWEVWPYLIAGASLHMPAEDVRMSAAQMVAWLANERITITFLPTPLYEATLAVEWPAHAVRRVLTGGDRLHRGPGAAAGYELFNHYGPTENSVVTTWGPAQDAEGPPPIGRPVDNAQVYILDRQLRPVPPGVAGELHIGGAGLSRGYIGQPELTAERFIPNPFSSARGARLYRSGDRARFRADGSIDFLGRVDAQVKLRGFRLEPGEIETVLAQHPTVGECVVVLRRDHGLDDRLVAYVTPSGSGTPAIAEIRKFLQQQLPEYMVPAVFTRLDALPLTPNGKVDRSALPAPDPERGDAALTYAAPRNPVEEIIAGTWAEVLGLPQVGIHDNFFEIGGHSLLATQVASRLRARLDVAFPLRLVFESPTVAGLAAAIRDVRAEGDTGALPAIGPAPADGPLPLSFAQQRLWFLDQMESGTAYNIQIALRLAGDLNMPALERSVNAIVQRHEALRTSFPMQNGRPEQVIAPARHVPLSLVDLTVLDADGREREARRLATAEGQRTFDLVNGPVIRTALLRLTPQQHVLLLSIHHIVADGWSMTVFTRELAAYYNEYCGGPEAALPPLPIRYADFARWQRDWLSGPQLESQLAYWKGRIGTDIPRLELPTDRPRPAVQTFKGAAHSVTFSAELSDAVNRISRRENATVFMTMMAALKALLSRYTGQQDIVVGSPIANRNHAATEDLIGFFVNTLVMRTDVSGDPTFVELLARVKTSALGAYDHQDLPFEKLVEELQPDRDLGQNPLFQVIFAVQNASRSELQLPGLTLQLQPMETTATRFDLEVHVWDFRGLLSLTFFYSTDLFDASTIARLSDHYRALLAAATAEPERRISRLPIMTGAEERLVLDTFSRHDAPYPAESSIAREFERQAALAPAATAVIFGAESLTYAELNRRANQLAWHLRARGVGPDVLVGLCVERSLELIVGLVAILKAGGAYVPLDPQYPADRLAFMLADTQVPVLLTQERLVPALPPSGAAIVRLDSDWPEIAASPETNPDTEVTAEHLAYVTYTSGSTGVPKGVEVRQRGVLRLVYGVDYVQLSPAERLLQLAPVTFDASTFEVWGALLHGGTCVVYPDRVPTPSELGDVLRAQGVTTMWLTSSLFNVIIDEAPEALAGLRQLLIGGEALSLQHVRRAQERLPHTQIINGYGPTESTTFACCYPIPPVGPAWSSVPIGGPISNTETYVLDPRLNPVPIGVPGELYIGGAGLARGYLRRPDVTADRFIPDPFSARRGDRLYRTGDLVRFLADGRIEFIGRNDDQVKIRGFRVELGEIESVLTAHPAVAQAVVLDREGAAGEKRLVAYVVQADAAAPTADAAEPSRDDRVTQWQKVYEGVIYDDLEGQPTAAEEPSFNIQGWNSTYTGMPIPQSDMREQVEQTVERIEALRPRRVLEIGCGTGLLLFRIAPSCETYVATDFSAVAIGYVTRHLGQLPSPGPDVTLLERLADNFEGLEPESFDCVVLNSIVQYFPDADYLVRVLKGAVRVLAPGGHLYVGDVRNFPLLETFHTSVQLHQAPGSIPLTQLRERVTQHMEQEQELIVDPALFFAMKRHVPRVTHARVSPKRGTAINELTKYRYDAILYVGAEAQDRGSAPWLDWREHKLTVAAVRERLASGGRLGLLNVPNARSAEDVHATDLLAGGRLHMVDELRAESRQGPSGAIDPEELWALAAELGCRVAISWARCSRTGAYDVLFDRTSADDGGVLFPLDLPEPAELDDTWARYTNNPLQATRIRNLVPQLRGYLQQRLPEYFVPSSFLLLDALPLTPNGKVDRAALRAMELAQPDTEETFIAPRTSVEQTLATIWAQVLGRPEVGIHDNFFALGGDSIQSIQIIARATQAGLKLSPKQMFQHQTIAELALVAESTGGSQEAQGPVTGDVPLTPIQHWFVEQAIPDAHHFNQANLFELRRRVEPAVIGEAMRQLVEHHDALRLRLARHADAWTQAHAEPGAYSVESLVQVHDLTAVPAAAQPAAIEAAAQAAQAGLDLASGPLIRAHYFDLGAPRHARLLIVAHHLVIDGVSWRILIEDLQSLCAQLADGAGAALPARTSSFQRWSRFLTEYAASEPALAELEYWAAQVAGGVTTLPVDFAAPPEANTVASTRVVARSLSEDETRALLQQVPAVYRTQINDVLLAALLDCCGRWAGSRSLLINLEGHGREALTDDIDLSRTIGWFTSMYPVRLDAYGALGAGAIIKAVKEQLRAVPNRGIGYGVLRYLGADPAIRTRLIGSSEPQIGFNYLGQFDQTLTTHSLLAVARESAGEARSGRARRAQLLEVNGVVSRGMLTMQWIYSERLHAAGTIEQLAAEYMDTLRAFIGHCLSPAAGGFTASDFPEAELNQDELEALIAQLSDTAGPA